MSTTSIQKAYSQEPSFDAVTALVQNSGNRALHSYHTTIIGNNMYAIWADNGAGNGDVFFARSAQKGKGFDSIVNISKNEGFSKHPQMNVLDSNVYVVWQDDSSGNKEIFFARSTDGGASFSNPINLSNNSGDSEFPYIAASGKNVYVVWRDNTTGNYDIYLRTSHDNGTTFSDVVNLSKNSGDSMFGMRVIPIVASGDDVYVVWQDYTVENGEILLARSTNSGISFSSVVNVSKTSGFSNHASVAVYSNNVYVVWLDDTHNGGLGHNYDVLFARSTDNGVSFSSAIKVESNGGAGVAPQIAVAAGNVYLTWFAGTLPQLDVFFSRSTDNGITFSTPANLSNNAAISSNPSIAVSGNNIYVAWQDNTPGKGEIAGNWEIFLRTSTDNGSSFGSTTNLSNNNGGSYGPEITVSGNNVYVVWQDNTPGNADLFLRTGTAVIN